jgi:hypothetical protein
LKTFIVNIIVVPRRFARCKELVGYIFEASVCTRCRVVFS